MPAISNLELAQVNLGLLGLGFFRSDSRLLKPSEVQHGSAMSSDTQTSLHHDVVYPESDGQPMADNTVQFQWITTIKGGLDAVFMNDPNVFVAGDLLWYPVEGDNTIRRAPDVMVVFGRPKGHRGSYLQWREDNIAPQVVFEILSPGNRLGESERKFAFYAFNNRW